MFYFQGWGTIPDFNVAVLVNALLCHEKRHKMTFTQEDLCTKTISELVDLEDIKTGEQVTYDK